MKKNFSQTLFKTFVFLSISMIGHAEENQNDSECQDNQNVLVESRPLLQKQKLLMEKKREIEQENIENYAKELEVSLGSLIIPIKERELTALANHPVNSNRQFLSPLLYQKIDYFPQENIIKTKDGAEWIFDKNDIYILRTWKKGQDLVISPKGRWFWGSNYYYTITNQVTGNSVDANLFLGPIAFGEYSNWIVGIDHNNGQIYLINGQRDRTIWEVSSNDFYLFKDWEVNDTLIIGENDSWLSWFSPYNHILINVNMNHYVRARQVSHNTFYRIENAG